MDHITYQEILSQPQVWTKVIKTTQEKRCELQGFLGGGDTKNAIFIGCGTSYYLALSAASVFAKVTGLQARAATASDVLFYPENVLSNKDAGSISLLISRSGTTTEVVQAAKEIKARLDNSICVISCRPGSDLVRTTAYPLVIPDADEKSVVMTRSFTSMLLLIQYLAAIISGNTKFEEELSTLPEKGAMVLEKYRGLAQAVADIRASSLYVYLGQGPYYGLACEGMLKIKEMSRSFSEAYHSLEFRHGPMSLVNEDMLITFLISEQARTEEVALLREMKALGAKTLVIAEEADLEIQGLADYLVEL